MLLIQNLAKKIMIRNSRWPSCPYMVYMVKIFKRLLLQNHQADLADILHEAYGALPYIKSLRSDRKPTLCGWGKFGK